jgi:hypothetical protein
LAPGYKYVTPTGFSVNGFRVAQELPGNHRLCLRYRALFSAFDLPSRSLTRLRSGQLKSAASGQSYGGLAVVALFLGVRPREGLEPRNTRNTRMPQWKILSFRDLRRLRATSSPCQSPVENFRVFRVFRGKESASPLRPPWLCDSHRPLREANSLQIYIIFYLFIKS